MRITFDTAHREIRIVLETARACGLSVCADLTDDCTEVLDPQFCWQYHPEAEQGLCPYLATSDAQRDLLDEKYAV